MNWKVSIEYQTPLEHFGCIVRQCDECCWEAVRWKNGITEKIMKVMYLQTLVLFKNEKRRELHIKRDWERYAKKNNITEWDYV